MNADEIMHTVEHITLSLSGDETRLIFYMLQALASIALNLEHIHDDMHQMRVIQDEIHLENQQS